MGQSNFFAPGQWNFTCALCGKTQKSDKAVKTWDNQYVCKSHKEIRNPQDFVRGVRDSQATPWTRPAGVDQFIGIPYTRAFSESLPIVEVVVKVFGISFGIGGYTDSAINGQMFNEWALNSEGSAVVNQEHLALSELVVIAGKLPMADAFTLGGEMLFFTWATPTSFNGSAFNSVAVD